MTRRAATLIAVLAGALSPQAAGAQLLLDVMYGADRNVAQAEADYDGWMNATVEWSLPSGLRLGIGTDHQFEDASPSTSEHLGWALYLTTSWARDAGRIRPFVRGGIGLGRAPCIGDTCGDGLYLRGSTGARVPLSDWLGLVGEVGLSRVSRPFGGAGLSIRP